MYKRRGTVERFVGCLEEHYQLVVRYRRETGHCKVTLLWTSV